MLTDYRLASRYFLAAILLSLGAVFSACQADEPVVEIPTSPSPSVLIEAQATATTSQPTGLSPSAPTLTSTWTPTPLQPTAPPTPTKTTRPTLTPLPTLLTPIQPLTGGQDLSIGYDLLFINAGTLHLWQPATGEVTSLLPGSRGDMALRDWRPTPDRQLILVVQMPENADPGFILSVFNSQTRQVTPVWASTDHYLLAFALAVDGQTAALITSPTPTQDAGGIDTIQVMDLESGQSTTLATCANERLLGSEGVDSFTFSLRCQELAAAPDGQTWLWRDIEGVWQGGLDQPPQLLVAHTYFDRDLPLLFSPTTDWSPDGRYPLLNARRFEGSYRVVLDLVTGQTITVPHSTTGIDEVAAWLWTSDNRLFTVRPQDAAAGAEAAVLAELWQVAGDQLVLDASLAMSNPVGIPPAVPSQLPDGRFAFIINHADGADAATRNLYVISGFDQPPQILVHLPPVPGHWTYTYNQSLTWPPDAGGVLYVLASAAARRPFYIPPDGSALLDLTAVLGNELTHQLWLP